MKYQLSVFFYVGQSTKIFSVKTGFEELKKNEKKTQIFGDPRNFGGSDATNELKH